MKIYFGNLPEGGQMEEDVRRLFSRYGEAWDCVIIKTYGFIHMEEEGGNKAIKQLDGFKLEGKRMRVEMSMRSVGRRSSRESKLGEVRIKQEKLMRSSSRESIRSFSKGRRLEMFNPVSDGNYSRLGGLGHFENNCNNTLAPFNSARDNGLNEFGDLNCNRQAGAGLCKPVGDHSFERRLAGSRDSGPFGLGNSVGNFSCTNLGGLSNTVGDHNCNMLGGCNMLNDGKFNMMAGVCSRIDEHSCIKPGGFNAVGGNNLDGFGGTIGDVCRHGGFACGCKSTVIDCNSYRLSAFRNTASDNCYERMGRIVKEEKDHGSSDSANRGNGDVDIKMKIAQLNKTIKAEERKPLINERLVNDWRNQVNYLERKIKHLETEKTEFEMRSQLQYLQKRVRDLQEEKKAYMDQHLDDHAGRSLPGNQRSSKTNKRVKPSTPQSSSKRGCFIKSQQKQSTTIRHSKSKHETGDVSDDDIQVIDISDDEDEIKIEDEREGEDVEILSESEFKEDKIFRNRGRDDNVNYISENEVNEVEIMSVNGSKRRKSLTKDDSKNGMQFEKFGEKCDWGVLKSERCNEGVLPLICLEDEKEDEKQVEDEKEDEKKDEKQEDEKQVDEKQVNFANDNDDYGMQNMSDMLGEVFNEGHDENLFQGVPPLDQVLGVPPPRRDVMSSKRKS